MSYYTERYSFEKSSGQSLAILQCGLMLCHSGHSSGRLVYPDYSAHFILEGKGVYYVNGKTYELKPGQGFMITPGVPNTYIADEKEPWKYIYVTFKGADEQSLVKSCGLDDDNVIFEFPTDDTTIGYLNCIHNACKSNSAKGYDALGYFLLVMSNIVRQHNESITDRLSTEHYIGLARSYIYDRSSYNISVRDIAAYVGIERTYLYRIFKRELGISPSKYLTDVRLKSAIGLMEHSELSVNEIAVSSGFYDISHFTKAFTSKYGVSPGKYRNEYIIKSKVVDSTT